MKAALKKLFAGFLIGAVVAFPLGMNAGRGTPLLSNPFAKQDFKETVKAKTEDIIENTKGAIHEATKPVQQKFDGKR